MSRFRHLCIIFLTAVIFIGTFSTMVAVGQERTVTIDTNKTGEPISRYIYGQFIEHLGRCIYGGIWAQMLEDRKFYYPITDEYQPYQRRRGRGRNNRPQRQSPYPVIYSSPWQIIGEAGSVTMVEEDPFVGEHTPLIQAGSGIQQLDLGLVKDKQYDGYIYLKAQKQPGKVTVSLVWDDNPQDQASVQLPASDQYIKSPFKFTSGADTKSGKLEIKVADGACFVGTVSLMPADNIKGMRADTIKLLKELNAPVYRWPGGNFVSGYNWRDGIGDRDKRPPRTNPAWTGVEHNDFGIHEYIEFCKTVGAEPMVSVNTGLGTVEQTAEEVEYANSSTNTELGKLRAQNGSPEPFNVKFWCVGNEMYGNWQLGNMPLEQYVLKHNDCAIAMKKADPSIKLIAVGNVGPWDEMMMEKCADHMDLISEHFYCQERRNNLISHIAWPSEHIRRIANAHRRYRREIDSLKDKDIRIAMDEWNYWYGPHVFGELGTRYFMKDALGIAKGLHEYYRNSDIIYMANYAQTVNVIGCIKTSKTAAAFETTGLVMKLYGNNYGTIPVEVTNEAEPIDVAAAWTADRKALTISVVNPTEKEQTITIDLKGAEPAGNGKLGVIANPDPQAYNDPDEEPKVVIEEKQLSNVTNKLTVPALSASLYTLPIR